MADSEFSEDITALWGPPGESALEPPRPNGSVTNGKTPRPAPTNGSHAELGALRAEMEEAFAQKLAVALSELLEGSEMRAAESLGKITERMASVQSDLTEVQEALRGLREEVSSIGERAGTRRHWGRSG